MENSAQRILMLFAMEEEAQPVINSLYAVPIDRNEYPIDPHLPMQAYHAKSQQDKQIFIAVFGKLTVSEVRIDFVGLQSATLNSWEAIRLFNPDLVMSVGTAGGNEKLGANVGDIYISSCIKYHDRRIPIPGYREFGIGSYPCLEVPNLIREFNFKEGIFSSGNSFDSEGNDLKQFNENGAVIKDMETAAVAEVAKMKGMKILGVRGVTDLLGEPSSVEVFFSNLSMVTNKIGNVIPGVVEFLFSKKLNEL